MGRHRQPPGEPTAQTIGIDPGPNFVAPDMVGEVLRDMAEPETPAGIVIDRVDDLDAYDSQMIDGHDGKPIDPRLLAVVRNARLVFGLEALAYAAVHVDLASNAEPVDIEAMHRSIGVLPPDGQFDVRIPTREPRVLLAWGDASITEVTDDSQLIQHGFGRINQLQRSLMVTRLRYIADLLENGPAPAEPGHAD